MEIAVVIEPLPDRSGFKASVAAPLALSAAGATAEAAHRELASLLLQRLEQGMELRRLTVPADDTGWLPDDELTRDWLEQVRQYRAECDAADRARLCND